MNPLLHKILNAPVPVSGTGDSPLAPARKGIAKLRYSHEAMIDLIIQRPEIRQGELAIIFDRTPSWISIIMSTDLFKAKLAERREQLVDPEIRESWRVRAEGCMSRATEILEEKLDRPADQVPDQLALQTIKVMGANLGLGTRDPIISQTQVHVHLEELGNNLVGLLRRRKTLAAEETIDVPKDGA